MESIYKQMNNIDDKESLNEKYNVRTFRDIKRLHEALTPENNDLQLIKSKWDDGQDDYGDIGDLRILQTIRKYYTPEDIECWYWRKDHSGDRSCYLVIETADGDEISFEENNGSLYQLDESLDKKYNVKNQRELEKLKEYWQSSQDHCREWIAEGMYDFVLKHLHPEIHAFVADTCRITVDKQHPDLVVVLKMINDASFIARVERMNRTGSNSNSIDFCEPYTVEISKQQPHCKELYTVTDKLCADYSNAIKLIQQNELVLVGKGKSAVWTRFSTNDSADVAYNKQKADIITEMISDSKYSDPIRVRVQIDTSNAKFKNGYDLQAAIKRTISGVTMQPEIRADESDGSYQLCFPGKSDWLKSVTEMLQYNISGKLTVEEV